MGYREDTLQYYNDNAADFIDGTINADMSAIYNRFEQFIKPESKILDLGCGSGRDSKYFLEKGYSVVPVDGSNEICRLSSEIIGIEVLHLEFNEIPFLNEFDAIWACASLLHISEKDLPDIIYKIHNALKPNGILYVSFKYGNNTRIKCGRFFFDCNESKSKELFNIETGFHILDSFITEDVRDESHNQQWLNIIAQKL